jgi:cell division septation protein DedD
MAANYKTDETYPVDQIQKIEDILAAQKAEAMRNSKENYRYHIVIGSFINDQNAETWLKKWKAKGRNSFILPRKEFDMEAVVYDSYPDIHAAYNNLDKVRNEITEDAWVIYYKQK